MVPPKTGPPGLSAARSRTVDGPPGPIMIATFGPPVRRLIPLASHITLGVKAEPGVTRSIVHRVAKEMSLGQWSG